jgi:replication factor A1
MQPSLYNLYDKIQDLKTRQEFKTEIKNLQRENDNLFDDEAAALMIVDKLGRNNTNFRISDLQPGMECTVTAKITDIGSVRDFSKKNGSLGRVLNLQISDESGSCNLVMWNNDIEYIENKKIKLGSTIKIINGYIKNGFYGLEINLGRWSLLETNVKEIEGVKEKASDKIIKGEVMEILPTRSFFKDNGEFGFVTRMKIRTHKELMDLTIWDEKVKEIQKYKQGDNLEIKEYNIRQKNGFTEYHINGKCMIKRL